MGWECHVVMPLRKSSPIPKSVSRLGGNLHLRRHAWLYVCIPLLVLAALASIVAGGGRAHPRLQTTRLGLAVRSESTAPIVRGDQPAESGSIASDDFNACNLDADVWTFVDPVGDGSHSMAGTFTQDAWLTIAVPAGSSHNVWDDGNDAVRMMQAVSDTDFEIEVKFDSGVSQEYQIQGVLVEQDSDHFLRLDFHSDGVGTRLYAVAFEPSSSPGSDLTHTRKYMWTIGGTGVAPLYMRVRRQGDEWELHYSFDAANWSHAASFSHSLTVTKVGVFAGNAGTDLPAHTAHIDYFFNTSSPIDPEDGARATLTVDIDGSGIVHVDPDKYAYDCGDVVTLSAEPAEWFLGWSGDLTGTQNPATITMYGRKSITASFSFRPEVFLPLAMTPPFSNYLFVGDFETGDLAGFYWDQNKPEVVGPPDPVRAGNHSMRCYLHRYQSEYSYRTMVVVGPDDSSPEGTRDTMRFEIGQEYWMGFSIYIPRDFVVDLEDLTDILMQVQATPDPGEDYRSPIYDLSVNADRWSMIKRWDTRKTTPPGNTFTGSEVIYTAPLGDSIGKWTDWVLHVKWSWQSAGFIDVWRDGVQVVADTGPNCSRDQVGPYTSLGVYKWPWRPEHDYPSNTDERLVYIDELRIAGADADYHAVAP
jgi:regulation of enolase protein 1 (concanavalin A-like superfamily)